MMFALCPAVIFDRPSATARSNANRTIRSLPNSEIVFTDTPVSARICCPLVSATNRISSVVAGDPSSNSIPVYMSSTFSRTTIRSTVSYEEGTPG